MANPEDFFLWKSIEGDRSIEVFFYKNIFSWNSEFSIIQINSSII